MLQVTLGILFAYCIIKQPRVILGILAIIVLWFFTIAALAGLAALHNEIRGAL